MGKMKVKNWKWEMMGCLAVIFLLVLCVRARQVWAADYSSAQTLSLNGAWSSEYWLTETEDEQWYKVVIPSDGKMMYKR